MNNILVVVLVVCLLFLISVLLEPKKKRRKHHAIKRAQLKKHTKQVNIQTAERALYAVLNIINSSYDPLPATIGYLRKIEPFVFEEFLLTCFQRQGYKIIRSERYTGDGGIDGKVYIDGHLYLIQAKRYSGDIKLMHLQEFGAVIKKNKCSGGYFVHTGKTGVSCREFLNQNPHVYLISGQRLIDFIKLST